MDGEEIALVNAKAVAETDSLEGLVAQVLCNVGGTRKWQKRGWSV